MKDRTVVKPYESVDIKIYAYSLPSVPDHNGCIKVGETIRDVEKRLKEQLSTAGLTPNIYFTKKAQKCNGEWFHDKDLHRYFILNNIPKKDFGTGAEEWFYFNGTPEKAEELTDKFIEMDYDGVQINEEHYDYKLREEQKRAVEKTYNYYSDINNEREFLWNAKPRFGKTLTTYDFLRKIKGRQFLIVTNRPAIANSWFDDFIKFISWQEKNLKFVSDSDALKGKAISRSEYIDLITKEDKEYSCIYFISLQDLKGGKVFGGEYDKYEWISNLEWDVLIVDEAHEGVDTYKTDKAFSKIKRNFTLHLSGTPFKAIASQKFSEKQIFNWSYMDEQEAKEDWNEIVGANPYENLPTLNLFTYQMSKLIESKANEGIDLENNNVDYAFDLNEFFKVDKEKFIYENDVNRFLDNLASNKFPFAIDTHRDELKHTLWILNRVDSVKALEKLLKKHPVFKYYEVIIAAGDGNSLDKNTKKQEKSLDRVRRAIKEKDRTITLSVGQLTTGVTVPEWTGVLMLSNIKSPALYFQAAFRCQNPYEYVDENGNLMRKENAYVFDFAPERTLTLYDEYANNLKSTSVSDTTKHREEKIKELLNFLPVIAEDEHGELKEINASEILTIPLKIKSSEVVKRGFMSNLLFANISSIFSAPSEFREILEKIAPEKQGKLTNKKEINYTNPSLNRNNEVEIPKEIVINETKEIFGEKIYREVVADNFNALDTTRIIETNEEFEAKEEAKTISDNLTKNLSNSFSQLKDKFELNNKQAKIVTDNFKNKVQRKIEDEIEERNILIKQAKDEYAKKNELVNEGDEGVLLEELENKIQEIKKTSQNNIIKTIEEETLDIVEEQLEKVEEVKKKTTEDEVRDRLRGFSRTIPAFLMAYGNRDTTLDNFEKNIEPKTFLDLTSITIEEFKKLRDGFDYIDEEGNQRTVVGLFDESVFNSSVKAFFDMKDSLSNYFKTESDKDIFDYIPPQKTNQIFTPRKVVSMMLDTLEENEPNIFKDKNKTFVDLYVKSGLYLTEIAKRLFKGLESIIPFEEERIKHIFEKQLYGFAPSNIICNIVKNFVYSDYDFIRKSNIIECDLVDVVESKKLKEKIKEVWGEEMKFDVVIGNPPYQENIGADSGNKSLAKQLFPSFIEEAINLDSKYVSFIVPSRWFAGDAQDKSFLKLRKFIKQKNHIKEMHFFPDSKDVFPGVVIKGGVCYFSYIDNYVENIKFITYSNGERRVSNRPLFYPGCDTILKNEIEANVLNKIINDNFKTMVNITKGRNAFGIVGKEDVVSLISSENWFENSVKLRCKSNEIRYVKRNEIIKNEELCFNKYKVFISKSAGAPDKDKKVIGIPYLGEPMTACTDSLIPIGDFETREEAENLRKYILSKFLRFIVGILKVSQNVYQNVYQNVPMQDFTSNSDIDWSRSVSEIDEQLYKKYELSNEEIDYIEKSIKSME